MKTWAYGERIASADLNGNFAELGTKRAGVYIASASVAIANATMTKIQPLTTAATGSDPGVWLDPATHVLKPPAGWYQAFGRCSYGGNVPSRRQLVIFLGTASQLVSNLYGNAGEGSSSDFVAGVFYTDGTQEVTLQAQQWAGAQTITAAGIALIRITGI